MTRRPLALLATLFVASASLALTGAPPASAAAALDGSGSTYVAQAMNQWKGDAQRSGLPITYNPTGSPVGLRFFKDNNADFAGTEAEFTSVYGGDELAKVPSYQYVPDVGGATAMMYNLRDQTGKKVDYLHLTPLTIAKIFTGTITSWTDPVISAENLGARFEDKPIRVVLRSGDSGTTALFYDFIAETAPDLWKAFRAKNNLPDGHRVLNVPQDAFTGATSLSTSDAIAQYIANDASGSSAIGFDEFGYAKFFGVPAAWVQNASGKWVQPYAVNISAALDDATLRPDLSQELSGVYASRNPLAYPISAYSYLVTPCAPAADRATCKDPTYPDDQMVTMAKFLDYIACDGQVKMAQLGYSPLPPVLSNEIQKSIQRMGPAAGPARALDASNCRNPRFAGGLGVGASSPPDPFAELDPTTFNGGGAGTPAAGATTPGSTAPTTGPSAPAATTGAPTAGADAAAGAGEVAAGQAGAEAAAVGGGSTDWREVAPVAYRGAEPAALGPGPGLLLVLLVAVPPLLVQAARRLRRRRRRTS